MSEKFWNETPQRSLNNVNLIKCKSTQAVQYLLQSKHRVPEAIQENDWGLPHSALLLDKHLNQDNHLYWAIFLRSYTFLLHSLKKYVYRPQGHIYSQKSWR